MTYFLCGKKGSGKSFHLVKELIEELLDERRGRWCMVSESLHLKLPELEAYCKKLGMVGSVYDRVRILSQEQCAHFWRHRGDSYYVPQCRPVGTGQSWQEYGDKPRKEAVEWQEWQQPGEDPGCAYFFDEAHSSFDQYSYDRVHGECGHYLKQERKLGDDQFIGTPTFSDLAKAFVKMGQEYRVYRNMTKDKLSFFTLPPLLQGFHYSSIPQGTGSIIDHQSFSRLDTVGVGSCYDTAGGSGVKGKRADIGQRAHGVPWWILLLFVVLSGVGAFFLYKFAHDRASAQVFGLLSKTGLGVQSQPAPQKAVIVPKPPPLSSPAEIRRQDGPGMAIESRVIPGDGGKTVYLLGASEGRGGVDFYLSDGRTLHNPAGAVFANGCLQWESRLYCLR